MRKLLVVVLLITACSTISGQIVQKRFTPNQVITQPVCVNPQPSGCEKLTPQPVGTSDKYEFLIESNGVRVWVSVDKSTYNSYTVGDKYP